MDDVDLTRDIETREESYALSAAAELIADEYHDDSDGGEWTPEIRWAVRKAWIAGRNWERRQQTAQNEAAILEVERSTERWTTLTSARQADKAEIERLRAFAENVRDNWGAMTGYELERDARAALGESQP